MKGKGLLFLVLSLVTSSLVFAQEEMETPSTKSILDQQIARKCLGVQHWSMVKCVQEEKARIKEEGKAFFAGPENRGKTVYFQYCYVCHGFEGKGNGPAAEFTHRRVADLTKAEVQEASDSELVYKITKGNAPMPGFTDYFFSKDDLTQVIKFVRSLRTDKNNAEKNYF